jgi:hypothetical protein
MNEKRNKSDELSGDSPDKKILDNDACKNLFEATRSQARADQVEPALYTQKEFQLGNE